MPDPSGELTWGAILDSLAARVALLDEIGEIVAVNQAWRQFALEAGDGRGFVGTNYLAGCEGALGSHAPEVVAGLRRVARRELDLFEAVYPHESNVGRLWYLMSVTPHVDRDGWVVVSHHDVTEARRDHGRVNDLEGEIERAQWAKRIRDALANEHFVLFAQPIIDLLTQRVAQRELLIRLRDPDQDGEVITPGAFLPVAEEYALIGEIDRWVVDQSAQLAAEGLAVELNVSAASISDPRLIPYIRSALHRSGADPRRMVFEITETALVSDEQAGRHFVEQMHQLGCKVALDDFGTGYGGFVYLKQLPIDYLKIDVEFVRDLNVNSASRSVVEAIVDLATRFGLKTIAEGVEEAGVLELLGAIGVDYAQGYHIARPAPVRADIGVVTLDG